MNELSRIVARMLEQHMINAESRQKQHQAGWFIFSKGRKLGELSFSHIDGHCYFFSIQSSLATETALNELRPLFQLRSAMSEVFLVNRDCPDEILHDHEFCMFSPNM